MVTWSAHGGGCCGIIHLWDFSITPQAYLGAAGVNDRMPLVGETIEHWLIRIIEQALKSHYGGGDAWDEEDDWNTLVEVVLTNGQVGWGWGDVLKSIGFKLVTSFRNSNSGNTCNVFHLETKGL